MVFKVNIIDLFPKLNRIEKSRHSKMRKNTYCNIPSMAEKCQCPVDLCISDFIAGCICCVLSQHSSGNAVQLWSTDQFHHCLRSSWLCGGRNNCSPLFCISNCLHIDPSSFRIPVNNAQNYYICTHSNQSTNRNREFSMQSIFSKIRNFIIPATFHSKLPPPQVRLLSITDWWLWRWIWGFWRL